MGEMKYMGIMEDKTIFLDTNILVFSSFTASQFHKRALGRIDSLQKEGYLFWISRQVIREYLVVKSRLLDNENKYDSKDITDEIRDFEDQFLIAEENLNTTAKLLHLIEQHNVIGKQIHDCNIVATMLSNDITKLLTNNSSDFARFSSLIEIVTI